MSIDTSQQIVEEKLKELKQKFEKREKRTLTSSKVLKLKTRTLKKYYEDRLKGRILTRLPLSNVEHTKSRKRMYTHNR